jgi:DNA primase
MAGQIPPQFIDDLLTRVDIVDVIDGRVPLKKAGRNMQACCPFHNEKTPSFTVSPEKQFYHCFGCGAHGTAIGFLMEYDQMSFPEAVQELADSVGMTVPVQQNQFAQQPGKQNLYDLLEKVSQYYVHQLQNHPQRQQFNDYLQQRGLTPATIQAFKIGMAPDGWDNVMRVFATNADNKAKLDEVGLLSKNEKGRQYDRFRNRVMFPIIDRRGRVIGFGGRVLDDSTPKYLNSPETTVFHKGSELYGLYQARKANRRLERIIIVEGYMDVVALAQFGVTNAVATLGTATTPEHLKQLLRSAPEVVFCFDGDRAGKEAAWRAAENALPMLGGNHELKCMFLPDGEDPDSLVRKEGADGFNHRVLQAQSYSDYFFSSLQSRVDISSMDGRARLVEITKPFLSRIQAGVYRDMMEQRLAEVSQTNRSMLDRHLDKAPQEKATPVKKANNHFSPVRQAITMLIQHPELQQTVTEIEKLKWLSLPGLDILIQLLETLSQNPHLTTAQLLERWRDHPSGAHLQKLALQSLSLPVDALMSEFAGVIQQLEKQATQHRQQYLTSKPLSALSAAEREEIKSFK